MVSWKNLMLASLLGAAAISAPPFVAADDKATEPAAERQGSKSRSAGTTLDDSVITAKVKTQLARADGVEALDIDVDTRNGVVELSGTVNNEAESKLAENLAADVEGVEMVENRLKLKSGRK